MSNYQELETNLQLSKANASKLVTLIYKAQQVELDAHYAFLRAVYDNVKKTRVEEKRLALINNVISAGHVLSKDGVCVSIIPEYDRCMDGAAMVLADLTDEEGKLTAPKKSDYRFLRTANAKEFHFSHDSSEQTLSINLNTGYVEYEISNNNRNVDDAKKTWMYQALYVFIRSHKFGRSESGVERYKDEYMNDSSYERFHLKEKQRRRLAKAALKIRGY
jgi:hypothetical protein